MSASVSTSDARNLSVDAVLMNIRAIKKMGCLPTNDFLASQIDKVKIEGRPTDDFVEGIHTGHVIYYPYHQMVHADDGKTTLRYSKTCIVCAALERLCTESGHRLS